MPFTVALGLKIRKHTTWIKLTPSTKSEFYPDKIKAYKPEFMDSKFTLVALYVVQFPTAVSTTPKWFQSVAQASTLIKSD
jgi:hypothetical protein